MLVAAHVVEVLLLLGGPVWLARWWCRDQRARFGLFTLGVLSFFYAEVLKQLAARLVQMGYGEGILPRPTEAVLVGALIAAFVAALAEELTRWIMLRRHVEDRRWKNGVLAGLGFGAGHALLLGGLVLAMSVFAVIAEDMTFADMEALGIQGGRAVRLGLRVYAWWEGSPSAALLAALQTGCLVAFHAGLGALVMEGLRRSTAWQLPFSVCLHFAVSASLLYSSEAQQPSEVIALVYALAGLMGLTLVVGTRARG